MRNNLIKIADIPEKTYKIFDFSVCSDFSPNLIIGDEVVAIKHKLTSLRYGPTGSQNAYFVNNRIFFYSSDKYIYEYINYAMKKIDTCESLPTLVEITYNGAQEILVISAEEVFILGKKATFFTVPLGSYITIYDNRLFIAEGSNICFGAEFDVASLSINLTSFGQASLPSQEGNILALVPYQDNLMVFCQKSIYILNVSHLNDFTLTKLNTCQLSVKNKSVAKVGDEIFFISNNKLCVYKNGKIDVLDLFFDNCLSKETQSATAYNEYYAITFTLSEKNYVYMFNTTTRKAHILSDAVGEFIGEKYAYDKKSKYLYQFSTNMPTTTQWTSINMDFGTHKPKIITSISINITQTARLYVFSESGTDFFTLKPGSNYRKLSFYGKQFYFCVKPSNNEVTFKDLYITYKILGD